MKQGPNVKKLIVHKMTLDMVPTGAGIGDVIEKFGDLAGYARRATEWVEVALRAVKAAPDNPYGEDDEAIAAEILRKLGGAGAQRTYRPSEAPR